MRTTGASAHPCGWRSSLPAAGAAHRRCKLRPAGEAGSRFDGIGRAVPARRRAAAAAAGTDAARLLVRGARGPARHIWP